MGRPNSLNEVVSGLGSGNCKSPQGLGTAHCERDTHVRRKDYEIGLMG